MWKSVLVAAALSAPAAPALAQADPTPPMTAEAREEARPLVDTFFATLQAGDISKAYGDLFAGTLMASKVIEVQNLITQTNFLFQTYGPIQGWSLMRSDCLAPGMCRNVYLVDTNAAPVFVVLTLYRRPSGWIPTTIYVTDVAQTFFELS